MRAIVALLAVALPVPAIAQTDLQQRVATVLAEAGPGTRFGLVVADESGHEIVAIAPNDRFMPASNTKLLPTAATFASLVVDRADIDAGATVRLEDGDVILSGNGDARMSSAAGCTTDCLSALADAVAAKTRRVVNVVGDDSLFPDQRWSSGMSWNNIPGPYGTAISALTLDDNEVVVRVTPGAVGTAPSTDLIPYYAIEDRVVTVAGGKTDIGYDRLPNERTIRLTGTIASGSAPEPVRLGIDDPAHYAAWRLKTLLEARGVRVTGRVEVRHRPAGPGDDPALRGAAPAARPPRPEVLARLTPPPLGEDLTLTNKTSQNLHAELLIRRLGLLSGTGSVEDGRAAIAAMLSGAGVARTGWDIADGSGMSTYNRLAPRAVVTLLRWAAGQPWGAAWRATLPVAGVDGTLSNRFKGGALEGKLFAKTGTINATNALSGYLTAKSGRTLTFSMFANDVPSGATARATMDKALELVAIEN